MADEEGELLKLTQKTFADFGKRNQKRFYIIEDLTLACDACKTPEAKTSIREMTKKYFQELMREQNTANAQFQANMKKFKELQKKGPSKDFGKKVKQTIDKFTSVSLSKNSKLKLKVTSVKELPKLEYILKF